MSEHTSGSSDVRVRELEEFSKEHPESDTRLYQIEAVEENLGLVYVTSNNRTLTWEGPVNFSRLEQEALWVLPYYISDVNSFSPIAEPSYLVQVSLILASGDLVELDYEELTQREQYRELMEEEDSQVVFARYDVWGELTGQKSPYSFTAGNPNFSESENSELAVQLPTLQGWSPYLVEWVVKHHAAKEVLKEEVNPETVANILSGIGEETSV